MKTYKIQIQKDQRLEFWPGFIWYRLLYRHICTRKSWEL